jgi:hypothetical protein
MLFARKRLLLAAWAVAISAAALPGVIANAAVPSDTTVERFETIKHRDRPHHRPRARSSSPAEGTSSPAEQTPSPAEQTPSPTDQTTSPTDQTPSAADQNSSAAAQILGVPRSGLAWHSGAWVGGRFNTDAINGFGEWRGRPTDVVTTYAERSSYQAMTGETWSISVWKGFAGKLNYGLSPLPDSGEGSFESIAAGNQDDVWRKVAQNLTAHGRGDSIVRIGWESNLRDWRWQVTTSNAEKFKAAFRRIVNVMRVQAPGLRFEFGVNCGSGLAGSSDRLAPLTMVYPGDDVVDLIGCDIYDWWTTHATNDTMWTNVLRAPYGPGIQDVTEFARKHRKGASFAEWGLATPSNGNGGGDNPYYIEAMFQFFSNNKDVVAFECYFDEPAPYIANSLYGTGQNPEASAAYARLW